MREYVLSVEAELDLDAVWEYIAEDDVDAASRDAGSERYSDISTTTEDIARQLPHPSPKSGRKGRAPKFNTK